MQIMTAGGKDTFHYSLISLFPLPKKRNLFSIDFAGEHKTSTKRLATVIKSWSFECLIFEFTLKELLK